MASHETIRRELREMMDTLAQHAWSLQETSAAMAQFAEVATGRFAKQEHARFVEMQWQHLLDAALVSVRAFDDPDDRSASLVVVLDRIADHSCAFDRAWYLSLYKAQSIRNAE